MKNNKIFRKSLILLLVLIISCMSFSFAFADSPTDEIENFTITCDLNENGTVNMLYHIEWKVLESDGIGPLSWVNIGIPSSSFVSFEPKSPTVTNMNYTSSGGSYLEIYLDREYYEGDTAIIDFLLVQDNMYQMNLDEDGITTFRFTPAWFDGIEVKNLTIKWNNENLTSWSPDCLIQDGYNTWTTSLDANDYYTVTVNYPNKAYAFNESAYIQEGDDYSDYYYSDDGYSSSASAFSGFFSCIIIFWVIRKILSVINNKRYDADSGFGEKKGKKITRTKVTYYPECPGCGAPRSEGESECSYCGRSLIESEEVLEEEELDEEAKKYDTDGEYKYSSNPNTFVRVHVTPVIIHSSGSGSRGNGGSSGHGSCVHSSCACASCACACACACASSGRAGCSEKDFYNTQLKLKQLERKHK